MKTPIWFILIDCKQLIKVNDLLPSYGEVPLDLISHDSTLKESIISSSFHHDSKEYRDTFSKPMIIHL